MFETYFVALTTTPLGLVVLGTSIWALFDARAIADRQMRVAGTRTVYPLGWLPGLLLIWIVAFPWYLVERRKYVGVSDEELARVVQEEAA